ncbi:cache domain-containing sensor histidine kinase [Cohnella soli]|uniref:histidine kinase n=1 Tax=Cohnella soli TaxID=425005 RepID=A0ABW0HZ06_9BACL
MIKSRLQNQFLFAFVLLSFLTLLIGSYLLYIRILSMLQDKTEQASVQSFQLVEQSIRSFRDEVNRLSQYILTDANVQSFLERPLSNQVEEIHIANGIRDKLSDSIGINKYVKSIFIYSKDGRALGYSDNKFYTVPDSVERDWLLSSDIYQMAKSSFPDLIWEGVDQSTIPFGDNQRNLISAYRGIKSYYQSSVSGMLVINVTEQTLADIYTGAVNSKDENIYILDPTGRTISASAKDLVGTNKSAYIPKFEKKSGSFIMHSEGEDKQLVYYALGDTGWTLCREVPVSTMERDIVSLRTVLFYVFILCLLVSTLLAFYITRKLLKPLTALVKGMRSLEKGQLGVTLERQPPNEIGLLFTQFNQMSVSLEHLMEHNRVVENQKRQAELNVLQAQIHPHFLYNTLNAIKWMAVAVKADNIMQSITALGNMIRPIFSDSSPIITLKEELDYASNYFTLMNNRYGEGVTLEIQVPDELNSVPIPRLLLQPVIENGLIHGLESNNYRGHMRIEAFRAGDQIVIHVEDNGRGIEEKELVGIQTLLATATDEKQRSGSGIGLLNVHIRLRLYYGETYGLQIERRETGGTLVTLRLGFVPKS